MVLAAQECGRCCLAEYCRTNAIGEETTKRRDEEVATQKRQEAYERRLKKPGEEASRMTLVIRMQDVCLVVGLVGADEKFRRDPLRLGWMIQCFGACALQIRTVSCAEPRLTEPVTLQLTCCEGYQHQRCRE